jgi:MFS family permease
LYIFNESETPQVLIYKLPHTSEPPVAANVKKVSAPLHTIWFLSPQRHLALCYKKPNIMPDHSSDPDFRTVIRLGWVSLLNDIGSETIARLVPFYVSGVLGASMAVVGTIEGIAETTSTLLKPVFGRLSDKNNGKKAFVLTGYLISSLARPLLALAASPLLVGFLRAADRFGKAVRVAPRDALIANSGNKLKQGKKFGINRAMDTIGAVAGLTLFALFLKFYSDAPSSIPIELSIHAWKVLCIASLVPSSIAILIIYFGVSDFQAFTKKKEVSASPKIRLSPILKRYFICVVVFGLANSSDAFILLKTRQLGYSLIETLLMIVLLNLFSSATAIPAAALSDRFGRRTLIAMGWTIYAATYTAIGLNAGARQPWIFALILGFYGLFYGFTEGVEKAWVADLTEAETRGSAYGVFGLVVGLTTLPASALFGWAWDRFGDRVPFLGAAALAFFATALLFGLVPAHQSAYRSAQEG